MSLFDAYVFVDWSSRNAPGPPHPAPDSVWVAEMCPPNEVKASYHRTRSDVYAHLLEVLSSYVRAKLRVLVGFDFPYGYPAGFCQCLSADSLQQPWRRTWEHLSNMVEDDDSNNSNRFEIASRVNREVGGNRGGPFWNCPTNQASKWLRSHAPTFPFITLTGRKLERLRVTEMRIHGVQEVWKLYGPGSVGSQALVGIPRVKSLRTALPLVEHSRVWPFETGFSPRPSLPVGPFILHAEMWPGIVNQDVTTVMMAQPNLVRDQAQVRCMCNWAASLDRQDALGESFDTPHNLTDLELQRCIEEEGWILGCC